MSLRYILETIKVDSKGRLKSSSIQGVYKTIEEVDNVIAGLNSNPKLKFSINTDYTLFDYVNLPNPTITGEHIFSIGERADPERAF